MIWIGTEAPDPEQYQFWFRAKNDRSEGQMYAHQDGVWTPINITEAPKQTGWQPIETAPRDGTTVDLWIGGERVSDCKWMGKYGGFCRWEDDGDCGVAWVRVDHEYGQPTHWMPLPEPPQD